MQYAESPELEKDHSYSALTLSQRRRNQVCGDEAERCNVGGPATEKQNLAMALRCKVLDRCIRQSF
jgi:hypothetical protein